ncbi:MAG TPA: hypothetical protein VGC76_18355 [Pyrinomonadaceae bacterium]|jgi:hypothetical protein
MADVKNIGGQPLPIEQNIEKVAADAMKLPNQQLPQTSGENAVGRGAVGQPIGLPQAEPTTQNALMPGVVTGRDATQQIAAEKMRSNAGYSATEVLLGLNRQPSTIGVLLAPPGNLEALRHITPTMRRTVLRNLLAKQRRQMRQLAALMRDEDEQQENHSGAENQDEEQNSNNDSAGLLPPASKFYNDKAYRDLAATTRMLDLLYELLSMQDYTLSQMATRADG